MSLLAHKLWHGMNLFWFQNAYTSQHTETHRAGTVRRTAKQQQQQKKRGEGAGKLFCLRLPAARVFEYAVHKGCKLVWRAADGPLLIDEPRDVADAGAVGGEWRWKGNEGEGAGDTSTKSQQTT